MSLTVSKFCASSSAIFSRTQSANGLPFRIACRRSSSPLSVRHLKKNCLYTRFAHSASFFRFRVYAKKTPRPLDFCFDLCYNDREQAAASTARPFQVSEPCYFVSKALIFSSTSSAVLQLFIMSRIL